MTREELVEAPTIPENEGHVQRKQGRRQPAARLAKVTGRPIKSTVLRQQQRKKYPVNSMI